MYRSLQILSSLILACLIINVAIADDKPKLLCAVTEVIDCGRLGKCELLLPEEVNLPDFITIDLQNNKIIGHNENHNENVSRMETVSNNVILQGIGENGRGWSLLLNNNYTVLSGAVVGNEYTFSIFGSCRVQ